MQIINNESQDENTLFASQSSIAPPLDEGQITASQLDVTKPRNNSSLMAINNNVQEEQQLNNSVFGKR